MHWYKTYEEFLEATLNEQQAGMKTQAFSESEEAAPIVVLAHELFDALPVHVFKFDGTQWREQLVDKEVRGTHKYRWVDGQQNAETVSKILNPDK